MTGIMCSFVGTHPAAAGRTAITVTANGNAQVDTGQSQFGGASAQFDGTGDYLRTENTSVLQLGSYSAWTIEMWYRLANTTGAKYLAAAQDDTTLSWAMYQNGANLLYYLSANGTTWGIASGLTMKASLSANTWYHVALVKNGTSYTPYVGGVAGTAATSASSLYNKNYMTFGGLFEGSTAWMNGHIDEIRISKIARYTTGFTPSASAFTNDSDTVMLLHCNGTDTSTSFPDDNA